MMGMIKKKVLSVIAAVLFLMGIATLLYPQVNQYYFDLETKQLISGFSGRMEEIAESNENNENNNYNGWRWLKELIAEYNQELYESGQDALVDAFSYQQVGFSLKQFGFNEEMVGYITIPRMGVALPIYLGANTDNLSKGAAQLTETSLPVGGVNTNTVIAGHRGYRETAMFRDIEDLEIGDSVIITNFCETLYYRVAEIKVINPDDIGQILIQEGRDLVTLITCHPYSHNYQRYVVCCERTTETDHDVKADKRLLRVFKSFLRSGTLSASQRQILMERLLPFTSLIILLIAAILILFGKKRRKKGSS